MDIRARSNEKRLLLDVATSHTLGAALDGDEIAAFFEYHTHDITLKRLESLLVELAEGKLKHEEILPPGICLGAGELAGHHGSNIPIESL